MTPLLSLATLCLAVLGGPAFAQTADAPPSTPGNPSARAYGATSGGVSWQRSSDDRRVVGYEITRDGTVLGVRDTLSYVAEDLAPGRGYNFAIVAIDSAGQRSGRALARIETPDARPNVPSGLSASVYSTTAAGITWERSGVFGERYEVKRDGRIVAAATNGTSYIDETLSGQRPYLFEVIAVNRQGQRSAAARLFVRTTGDSNPPPVSAPAAPSGLRSVVYSSTAGAIAWERAGTAGLRYEVRRGGELVATTDGTSYVDRTLEGGRTYTYSIIAIDGARRSGASAITLTASGSDGGEGDDSKPPQLLPVEANVELIADKTFRIRWERSAAADYYRVLENPDGVSGYTPVTGRLDASTERYDHRVALHERTNARYIVEACNADDCTLSVQQLVEVQGSLAEAVGYFKAARPGSNDQFGSSVALSADGQTMAVGAPGENSAATGVNGDQDDDSAIGSGAVYVFVRVDGRWRQQAYVKASNSETLDEFGHDVSLSADGGTLAVGAIRERSQSSGVDGDQDNDSDADAGAVYVFARNGETWRQQAYLKASNTQPEGPYGFEQRFGWSVTLSAEGDTLAVGAIGEDSPATGVNGDQNQVGELAFDSGAVYVFVRDGERWRQQAYLKAENGGSRFFGQAVSLSDTGDTLAVGLNDPTSEATTFMFRGPDASDFFGAVYVFARTDGRWESHALLRPETDSWDDFGGDVSLSGDGNTLAASGDDKAYIFERGDGGWGERASVVASNADRQDDFGQFLSLSADGRTLAVGADEEDGGARGLQGEQRDDRSTEGSGAVYVFRRGDGDWPQRAYVKASNSREAIRFGRGISLNADGGTLAIGAPWEGNPTGGINGDQEYETFSRTGAVYLY